MDIKRTIAKVVEMYFAGEDWKKYLAAEIRRRKLLENDFQRMFKGWKK